MIFLDSVISSTIRLTSLPPLALTMAQPQLRNQREIRFRTVQLFKAQSLGIGSYGAVCKAKCDDLPCAAKIIHPTLVDPRARALVPRGKEHRVPISRFEQECEFLSSIKHPNIVQYLGTSTDSENGLPVLLMELMDESLTSFVERSQRNLPYHIEVTVSNDIALALSFLHSNGIIHRDLSSNNVLMIGNSRAKVTDFGMAKLAGANLQATRVSLTQTPGADVYMPPEATQIPPVYSEKIDCFSHGVLGVQIMTREFPKPGNRLKTIQITDPNFPSGSVRVAVSEVERRKEHIDLINHTHPLLAVALDCLKDDEGQRPSAQEICGRLAALKQAPQFTQSLRATPQQSTADEGTVRELRDTIASKDEIIDEKTRIIASKDQVIVEKTTDLTLKDQEIATIAATIARHQQEIQQQRRDMETATRDKVCLIETKDSELQRLRQQAREKEQVIAEFQQALQQALLREAQRISQPEQLKLRPQASSSGGGPVSMELTWRKGRKALCAMARGMEAVVQGSVVYLRPSGTQQVDGYNSTTDDWFPLPGCPHTAFSLAVVDNLLTAIGGWQAGQCTNTLLSLTEEGRDRKWVEMFPPMLTKRDFTCAVSSGAALIVIGGQGDGRVSLNTVEVMDVSTKVWTTVASLPEPLNSASGTICGDRVYILGASHASNEPPKSVFTCSLSALLQSSQPTSLTRSLQAASLATSTSMWSKVADLPVVKSTCVSLQGRLLAIGGCADNNIPTTAVRTYDPTTNSWSVTSHMTTPREWCFAAVLPGNRVIAVGGFTGQTASSRTDSVEIANL